MNRQIKILSYLLLGLLALSVCFSAVSQAALVSDQLEIKKGCSIQGKLLYSNASVSDELMAYLTIKVDDIFNDTTTLLNIIKLRTSYDLTGGSESPLGLEEFVNMDFVALIFEHNRTTILPVAELSMHNSTYSMSATVLYLTNLEDMLDFNNAQLTIQGVSYIYGDMTGSEPNYSDYLGLIFVYALLNAGLLGAHLYTPFAINPIANVGDTVHYYPANGLVEELVAVTTSEGRSYDTIHVAYGESIGLGLNDIDEFDCYYEQKTGMLIRSIEKDTSSNEQFEFQPSVIDLKTSALPFPFTGIVISIVALGIITVILRKKK